MSHPFAIGSLQVTLSAPTPIRPDHGAAYRLSAGRYTLMHGTGSYVVAHVINADTGPATVAGSVSRTAGILTIEPRHAFMMGWSIRATTWRALQMCGALVDVSPDDLPPGVRLHVGPAPADADFLVEALDGTSACIPLPTIAAYLAGKLPMLAGLQSPAWRSRS